MIDPQQLACTQAAQAMLRPAPRWTLDPHWHQVSVRQPKRTPAPKPALTLAEQVSEGIERGIGG